MIDKIPLANYLCVLKLFVSHGPVFQGLGSQVIIIGQWWKL